MPFNYNLPNPFAPKQSVAKQSLFIDAPKKQVDNKSLWVKADDIINNTASKVGSFISGLTNEQDKQIWSGYKNIVSNVMGSSQDAQAAYNQAKPNIVKGNEIPTRVTPRGIVSNINGKYSGINPLGAMGSMKNVAKNVAKPAFQGLKNLSTKLIEDLKGKITVPKSYIEQRLISSDLNLKQVEKDLIRNQLLKQGDNIEVSKFADNVQDELLPLKIGQDVKGIYGVGMYESITLPAELRGNVANYTEHIWESPIKTSAGDTHFEGFGSNNYFGHTRIEDLPIASSKSGLKLVGDFNKLQSQGFKPQKIRRVIEVQSDLYQKGNLEKEISRAKPIDESKLIEDTPNFSKLQQYNDPTAHFRMVREEVKQAAIDGKTKLQFPTGETAMKIEGLGETQTWLKLKNNQDFGNPIKIDELKVGQLIGERGGGGNKYIITDVLGDGKFKAIPKFQLEKEMQYNELSRKSIQDYVNEEIIPEYNKETFDISGKVDTNNPIYKFYEKELGRYLKSKYNASLITDKQGVSWYELNVNPELKNKPVEAFGFSTPQQIGNITGGLGVATGFGFLNKSKQSLEEKRKELSNLKSKEGDLFIEGNDLQVQRDALLNKKSITPLVPTNKSTKPKKAIITVYNPVPGQTDSSPNTGSFMTKMEFGDIAVGNRKEHQIAKDKFFKSGEDTFITIPELSQIKTPYGQGVFRVRDTMAKRFDNQGKLDVFIPEGMNDLESLVRHVPKGSYY